MYILLFFCNYLSIYTILEVCRADAKCYTLCVEQVRGELSYRAIKVCYLFNIKVLFEYIYDTIV